MPEGRSHGKIEITKKSKARQKNFQQIAATEPTPCLHYVVRMRFLLPSYKGIRSAARPINGRNSKQVKDRHKEANEGHCLFQSIIVIFHYNTRGLHSFHSPAMSRSTCHASHLVRVLHIVCVFSYLKLFVV